MVKSKKKSFTLIELLVVSAIIVLLSGTSLVYLSTYKNDRVLNSQVSILVRTLELAKNKATSGDVSLCSNNSTAHVNGYSVSISATAITLNPGCDTIPTPVIYPIPSNIQYTPSSVSFRFGNNNYQGGTILITLKDTDTNKCKFVQIDETGLITNGDTSCP